MPTNSITLDSDTSVGFAHTYLSDASVGFGLTWTSDAQVGFGLTWTSDAKIGWLSYQLPYISDAYIVGPPPPGPGLLPKVGCEFSTPCIDPANPLGNFSSEAPDPSPFVGFAYPIFNPNNPTNSTFTADGCVSSCVSSVSQEDANLCASRQAFICANTPPPGPFGPGTTFYFSQKQSCVLPCADGNKFTYVVPAGSFIGNSQAAADAQALAYACHQANVQGICLGTLPDGCINSAYSANVQVNRGGVPPLRFSIVAGVIPPGLIIEQTSSTSAVISGTPTLAGSFSFTVQVTDSLGNWMQKDTTICIVGSTKSSLPNGSIGNAYSQQLTAPPCATVPLSWQIVSGALPPGLSLDESTGQITGTPSSGGTYNFVVRLQTEAS